LLEQLAARGCNRVLWECGPALAAAALQQDCVQELAVVIAPKLLGGLAARTPLGELGFTAMDQVIPLQGLTLQRLERDAVVQALVPPL
jgi:diaminohydroxyphosphoribosylaminopyrimidine deaminase / 5-amino-6-(5-phosphoribosylamino)uracil reductase